MFGMDKLVSAVVGLVFLAASIGALPRVTLAVLKAQAQFIQDTKAPKWGRLPLLRD
jgi:hypothetical protein